MESGLVIACVGIAALCVGAAVEVLAFAGMASYRVRRRLYRCWPPIDHPLALQAAGCWFCFAGGGLFVVGQWLRR